MHLMTKAKTAFLNMKIRKKTLFLFLVAGIIPFLLYIVYSNHYTNQLILEREKSLTTNSLQQAVMSVENKLETYENLSNYLYNNNSILMALNTEYDQSYFEMYKTYRDVFEPIYLTYYAMHPELEEIIIYSSGDLHPNKYVQELEKLSSKPWFSLVEGRHVPTWVIWEENDTRCLFSVRLIGDSRKYHSTNYLYFLIDYESFFRPFQSISEDTYDILVTDEQNSLLFSTSNISEEEKKQLLSSPEQSDYMLLTDTINTTKWNVYFYKPYADVQSYVQNITRIIYVFGFFILSLLGIMFFLLSLSVVSPIESLTRKIREVCNGDTNQLTVNIDSNRQDEIGILFHDFSQMMERIQYYVEVNLKNELEKKAYQSKILYAQINPHFLYNALSLINSKAIMSDQEEISNMTLLLSTFYRTVLNRGDDITTLGNELLNIQSYIQLQLLSYSEPVSVVYEVDDTLTKTPFPNFILQPLVENALDHGLKNSRRKDKVLHIEIKQEDHFLSISIRDNGVGMDEKTAASLFQIQTSGYGIKNVNERLHLIYGEEYSLVIQSQPGEGTQTVIKLPIQEELN